ncbi:transcription elongation factor GreA [Acetobacteraceae bacterium]|nr:transcription elongation factor GreA [Acetobacteraceae bacterium]
MQKMPITPAGLRRLEDELRQLKSEERPAVIKAIAEAREHGDLSENAEYHAAREKQSFIEGRIVQLEGLVGSAEVIDSSGLTEKRIRFGAFVDVADEETGKEQSFQIVGVPEADIKEGRISISSPIARALIGKEEGDVATVPAPGGDKAYEIIKVTYR